MATSGRTRRRKTGRVSAKENGRAQGAAERRRGSSIDVKAFTERFDEIVDNVETVVKGKREVIRLALVAALCEGHVLLEDVPGTGKSVLARALAQSMDATTARVQCTPDLLPADVTGAAILDQKTGELEFRPGPLFHHVVLVDEVNRATPKTQSAFLEAMQERRVSSDGVTRSLPRPFLVLATQNPVEIAGTYPLPEAQLDRFLFRLKMGYLDREREFEVMFDNSAQLAVEDLGAVVGTDEIQKMIDAATQVQVSDEVGFYIVDLVTASRDDPSITMGGSSRATIALVRAARALAASDGRAHVYPDDVREALHPVLAHRLVLSPEAVLRGETAETVVERIAATVRPPVDRA